MPQENLLSSVKNLVSVGISLLLARLELISLDVQIAKNKFISVLIMIISALFLLFFGLVLLVLYIMICSWEYDRTLALGLLTGSILSIDLILILLIIKSLRSMPKLFETSIAELTKDREEILK